MIILGHHCFAILLVKKLSHNRCALFFCINPWVFKQGYPETIATILTLHIA